jgi:YD repeat-containing protein
MLRPGSGRRIGKFKKVLLVFLFLPWLFPQCQNNEIIIYSLPTFDDIRYVNTEDGLRLRGKDNLAGEVIALLPYGESVNLLETRGETQSIDGATGKWNRVFWNKQDGFVFGGFLSKDDPLKRQKNKRGVPKNANEKMLFEELRRSRANVYKSEYFYDFDMNGNKIREYHDGAKAFNFYDNNGALVERIEYIYNGSAVWTRNHFKYFKSDKVSFILRHDYWTAGEMRAYEMDVDRKHIERTYDKNDLLIKETDYLGKKIRLNEYQNGKIIKVELIELDHPETIRTIEEYKYDQNGNLIKRTMNDNGVTNYLYNDKNQLIRKTTNADVTEYTYDAETGKLIYESTNYSGYPITQYKEYTYRADKLIDNGSPIFKLDSDGYNHEYNFYKYDGGLLVQLRYYFNTGSTNRFTNEQENRIGNAEITDYIYVRTYDYIDALNRFNGY